MTIEKDIKIKKLEEQVKQLIYANQCKDIDLEELKATKEIRHGFGSSYKVDVNGELQPIEKIVKTDDGYIIVIAVSSFENRF